MSHEMNEPHHWPDMADEVDKPEDELAELMLSLKVPREHLARMIEVVHEAGRRGILEQLGYGELGNRAAHELIRRVLALVGDGNNAGLRAWCIDFLAGTNVFGGKSETQIGIRWGFTRSNVSYLVKKLQRQLGMGAIRGGKSDAVSGKFAARAKRNHAEGKGKGNGKRPASTFRGAAFFTSIICPPN